MGNSNTSSRRVEALESRISRREYPTNYDDIQLLLNTMAPIEQISFLSHIHSMYSDYIVIMDIEEYLVYSNLISTNIFVRINRPNDLLLIAQLENLRTPLIVLGDSYPEESISIQKTTLIFLQNYLEAHQIQYKEEVEEGESSPSRSSRVNLNQEFHRDSDWSRGMRTPKYIEVFIGREKDLPFNKDKNRSKSKSKPKSRSKLTSPIIFTYKMFNDTCFYYTSWAPREGGEGTLMLSYTMFSRDESINTSYKQEFKDIFIYMNRKGVPVDAYYFDDATKIHEKVKKNPLNPNNYDSRILYPAQEFTPFLIFRSTTTFITQYYINKPELVTYLIGLMSVNPSMDHILSLPPPSNISQYSFKSMDANIPWVRSYKDAINNNFIDPHQAYISLPYTLTYFPIILTIFPQLKECTINGVDQAFNNKNLDIIETALNNGIIVYLINDPPFNSRRLKTQTQLLMIKEQFPTQFFIEE